MRGAQLDRRYSVPAVGAVQVLLLLVLFFTFTLLVYLTVPVHETDPYVHVAPPPGLLPALTTPGLRSVSLPGGTSAVVLRMPAPRGVDADLLNGTVDACAGPAAWACGAWRGAGAWTERSFGQAGREAGRRLETALEAESLQAHDGGERDERTAGATGVVGDAVMSCMRSARVPEGDDLAYAAATLGAFVPPNTPLDDPARPPDWTYVGGWALGQSVARGDTVLLDVRWTVNPLNTSETLVSWSPGTQARGWAITSPDVIERAVERACMILVATEQFPWEAWPAPRDCTASVLAFVGRAIREVSRGGPSTNDLDYWLGGIEGDLYAADRWRGLAGAPFVAGFDGGVAEALADYEGGLAAAGLAVPRASAFRQWTRSPDLVAWAARAAAEPLWSHWLRAAFIMANHNYVTAIMYGHGFAAPDATRTHGAAAPGWALSRAGDAVSAGPLAARAAGEADLLGGDLMSMSTLVRTDLWRACAWQAREAFPVELDNAVARSVAPPSVRADVRALVGDVLAALRADVAGSDLPAAGRAAVLAKLDAVAVHVAVPWDEAGAPPASLPFDVDARRPWPENVRRARLRETAQTWAEAAAGHGKAPAHRRSLLHGMQMPTTEVNAYYDPAVNGIFLLAGVLQPPFYDPSYDRPTKLAALGAVVGHELAHAFDNDGSQHDATGSLRPAWLPEDVRARWAAAEACFVRQYDAPTPLGTRVDARRTLGENMADVLGLRAAYRALWLDYLPAGADAAASEHDVPAEDKHAFVAVFAQLWCSAANATTEARRADADVHAPPAARTNGALRNLVDPAGRHVLSGLFGCRPGSDAVPAGGVCSVWEPAK